MRATGAQRAVDQVRRDEWNAHERSHTPAGKWIKGTRCSLLKSPEKQTIDQLAKKSNKPTGRSTEPSCSRKSFASSTSSKL